MNLTVIMLVINHDLCYIFPLPKEFCFSLELDMYPPHPHEFSVEMIRFLLNDPDVMNFLQWQLDSLRSVYSLQMFNVPSPLFYRSMSKFSTKKTKSIF